MQTSIFSRCALGISAAALLAGCGVSQPPIGAPGAMPQTSALATHADRGTSWMLPGSASGDLLYATGGCGGTCVISYPQGQIVGSIAISGGVWGDCSDSAGDVFVINDSQLLEYAHGGTIPVATLSLPGSQATGCAIDPSTGNLAVVFVGGSVNVAVFPDAAGTPALYDSHLSSVYCGYDNASNLFVSGTGRSEGGISELPNGALDFSVLAVKGKGSLGNPGQVQWDGTYMTYEGSTQSDIKVSRIEISGSRAKVVGTTHFKGQLRNAYQSWIYGTSILIPYSTGGFKTKKVGVWAYPKGGKLISRFGHFPDSKSWMFKGVTVSVGPSH
jgi:hypothetical protein